MRKVYIVVMVLLIILVVATGAAAMNLPDEVVVDWASIGAGGGYANAGSLELDGIAGQGIAGEVSQADTELCSGFLCFLKRLILHLPLILENYP